MANGWTRCASWVLLGLAVVAPRARAESAFFAMDTGTKDASHQTAEEQVALIEEVGFAGIAPTYSTPEALREMLEALDRRRLKMLAVYVGLDLDADDAPSPAIQDVVSQLQGREAFLWLYVTSKRLAPSDVAGDQRAVRVLREVADLAAKAGVRVALYPHSDFWVERVEDAVRLARQVARGNLGVTFNLCHWLKVDGQELEARLDEARRFLFVVTINGADTEGRDWTQLIQPLDSGSFDVGRVMAKLRQQGYSGPIGLQHYGIGGDARRNLSRSMAAWRRLQVRERELLPAGRAFAAWRPASGWAEAGTVTLDPQDFTRFTQEPGSGVIVSSGRAEYLMTREDLGDIELYLEFVIPSRSNSGVYLMGSYEVQIYDSFGVAQDHYPGIECGGIYPEWVGEANVRGHSPLVNASRPAGAWQTLDVVFRAPRFDASGRKVANARFVRVVQNGRVVHEDVEVFGPTRSGLPEQAAGPLRLQGDHGPVAFRNIRVRPLQQDSIAQIATVTGVVKGSCPPASICSSPRRKAKCSDRPWVGRFPDNGATAPAAVAHCRPTSCVGRAGAPMWHRPCKLLSGRQLCETTGGHSRASSPSWQRPLPRAAHRTSR